MPINFLPYLHWICVLIDHKEEFSGQGCKVLQVHPAGRVNAVVQIVSDEVIHLVLVDTGCNHRGNQQLRGGGGGGGGGA